MGLNESLLFWKDLIDRGELTIPFEVVHVDSHADLGLGYASLDNILNVLLYYSVEEHAQSRSELFALEEVYNGYLDWDCPTNPAPWTTEQNQNFIN